MKTVGPGDFAGLLLSGRRLIDVRAPVEFNAGAIPGAVNLPLLTDEERHQVGLTYKTQGQQAAIDLGHRLVTGAVRRQRTESWLAAAQPPADAVLYCFRGGLRSQTAQTWLQEAGWDVPIVTGGYKALRGFLLDTIAKCPAEINWQVVSGPTGSGKTDYLKTSGHAYLDLEGLAKHRGSAFGGLSEPQPTQQDFENALALELLRLARAPGPVLIEDESQQIGDRTLPEALFRQMKKSPKIILAPPFEARVEKIFHDYVLNSSLRQPGNVKRFAEFRRAVTAISRKLGGARTQEILHDLQTAQADFEATGGLELNRVWIRKILQWYYDPRYR